MSTSRFQPPPTWALPIIQDPVTGAGIYNPIWLKWFVDLSEKLGANGMPFGARLVPAGEGLSGAVLTVGDGISLAQVGVPGTYSTVTTDPQGRVVSGGPPGLSVTIITAKITPPGTRGSMTFTNGVLTAHVPAT